MADYTIAEAEQILRNVKSQMQDSQGEVSALVSPLTDQKILYSDDGVIKSGSVDATYLNGIVSGNVQNDVFADKINIWNATYSKYLVLDSNDTAMDVNKTLNIGLGNSDRSLKILGDVELNQSLKTTDDVIFNSMSAENYTVSGKILGNNSSDKDLYLGDKTIVNATTFLHGETIDIGGGDSIDISCGANANGTIGIGHIDNSEPISLRGVVSHSGTIGLYGTTPTTQPAAVANATNATDVITQLNALLAGLRSNGTIAT